MDDVGVISDSAVALLALDPTRTRLLAALAQEPASAAGVAARLGLPRQRVGYHLEALRAHGLVVEVERRRHGGLVERLLAPSAAAYVVTPDVLGPVAADPARLTDRLSASYLLAVAARLVREVAALASGARRAGRPLPTLCLDAEVGLATATARAAFADDLAAAVRAVAARHHDASARHTYRVVLAAHPAPAPDATAPLEEP